MDRLEHVLLIGPGNVGTRLAAALEAAGVRVERVTRTDGWPRAADPGVASPRLVAVREDDLPDVLDRLAPVARSRLLLVQNGFLEPVLGELGDVSRGLIWFTAKGEFFAELRPSVFSGPLADPLVRALVAGGLAAEVQTDRRAFMREMIIKGAWNGVVGLPLAVHGLALGEYLERCADEARALVDETCAAAGAWYGVEVDPEAAWRRLLETTPPIRWVRASSARALRWRNGAVVAMGRARGVPTPVNERLVEAVAQP
ncbi:MAG: hypothetical protein D6738_01210 [Acidobacteria bacterium]|nr:MAG: hypothetical protein D6738_01210 [Acidobacteriota bacterium]